MRIQQKLSKNKITVASKIVQRCVRVYRYSYVTYSRDLSVWRNVANCLHLITSCVPFVSLSVCRCLTSQKCLYKKNYFRSIRAPNCVCCCCCWVRRPACHERMVCQSAYMITCSGSVVRMSSGRSVVPRIWSRFCCVVEHLVAAAADHDGDDDDDKSKK